MVLFSSLVVGCFTAVITSMEYDRNVIFYLFKHSWDIYFLVAFKSSNYQSFFRNKERFLSPSNSSVVDQGCDLDGNFTMIVHGWNEGISTPWLNRTIAQFLRHRGGCVFFIDYSKFANAPNYFNLVSHFEGISRVLTNKMRQIGNFDRQYCFGFSFGSRLCIDAGINIGNQQISNMDLCDPAGPGFDRTKFAKDPKLAAKNVACINTSVDKGTKVYNCHQNFRMGRCGNSQAAEGPRPMGNHGLCPYFYNEAFDYKFVPSNFYKCSSQRTANVSTPGVRMGYMGNFDRKSVRGDIFIATVKNPPYVLLNQIDKET